MRRCWTTVITGGLIATALVLSLAGAASAATVTNTNDSGPGSLRQAIADAAGGETISIPAGAYELASVLVVNKSLTLTGAGARATILDGGHTTQIFSITAPAAQATITGVTMRNGKSSGGGALASSVPLTLTDDAILGSSSSGGGGALSITAAFTIERALFAGNSASGSGGAIYYGPSTPVVGTVADSTMTQNSSGAIGGAIDEQNTSTESLHLLNDSFVGNTATSQGGVFRAWSGTHIDYRNTLFVQNQAPAGPNCEWGGGAVVTSLGHNAQDVNDPECLMTQPTDKNTVVPQLGLLQGNGGPTDTLLPALGSPLIDAGDPANCPGSDQRGVPHPQGGGCDIGAVERTAPSAGGLQVSNITTSSADLSAVAGAIDLGGSASFDYGTTPAYGSTAALTLFEGLLSQPVAVTVGGLAAGTTYHVRFGVSSPDGSAGTADSTFTTATPAAQPHVAPRVVPVTCRVPNLRLLSLAKAKTALRKAHCALGAVKQPKHLSRARRRKLVVLSQSPGARRTLKAGTKVKLILGFPPKRRHKHKR
jgi:hypothetical protein